jgi:signal transduction histidine kinase/DNA-binding response OmpR family regulator
MKIMKHAFENKLNFILVMGSVLLLLATAGCNNNKEKTITIGFSQCVSNDLWRQQMMSEMKREASFHPNVNLMIMDAGGNSEKQAKQIELMTEKKVDLLIISPNESIPVTPAAVEAYKKGIPTIIIDRKIASDQYTAYIGANNYEIGRNVGLYIINKFKGKANILEITGLEGSSPAQDRQRGLADAIRDYPQIHVVHKGDGGWEKSGAEKIMRKAIEKYSLNVVFGQNDAMALGAREVADSVWIKGLFYIGIDALPQFGLQLVDKQRINASFLYPTGGDKAIELALNILNKKPFKKQNTLASAVVDESNARVLTLQQEQVQNFQSEIEQQIEQIKQQRLDYNNQKSLLNISIISLALLVVFAIALFASYLSTIRKNHLLAETTSAMKKQKDLLESQNRQIWEMNQKVEAATQAKIRFFTNISHEIRTPLTLILAPVNSLLDRIKGKEQSTQHDLLLIKRNSERLLRLVNQLMDFRRIELGKIDLSVSKSDIVSFTRRVFESFQPMAEQKKINYHFHADVFECPLYFDEEKIDKVIFNLLSNAFKFISPNGKISVKVNASMSDSVHISVEDNGPGIASERQQKIFERFYQQKDHRNMGTGIGLSLSRELIQLHKGKLLLKSEVGNGSVFTVVLRKGKNHFASKDLVQKQTLAAHEEYASFSEQSVVPVEVVKSPKSNTLLIVEDDEDLKTFLYNLLSPDYNIIKAGNGKEAFIIIERANPDLIITDVMMPEMNGLEFVQKLRNELSTCHIPVIMLTARASQQQKIEGIEQGADAYIEKPFTPQYLQVRIRKLLDSRKKLQEYFSKTLHFPEKESDMTGAFDKKFLEKVESVLQANHTRSDFSVEEFGQLVGLSRIHLYRKIKALTGLTPSEFVNKYRLHRAVQKLKNNENNISGIALEVGFSSAAYFSKRFKEEFGYNPSEYIKGRQT